MNISQINGVMRDIFTLFVFGSVAFMMLMIEPSDKFESFAMLALFVVFTGVCMAVIYEVIVKIIRKVKFSESYY